ncbi:hypothetical protein DERP_011194 [Dermatophagoides pteronyssinus]|uniref:Uncharacterized protein n=1 Tax=Dermatophagoides pteronyssinus TaxID=6956 RepID=A0ABQ8JD27_DERPT|nr:hypothetical protein DERP_011194 [Dermatophagoides pteronyssinus]
MIKRNKLFSTENLPTQRLATSRNFDSFVADNINLQPTDARLYARPSPIPDDAPVIHIIFPFNESTRLIN